jgi:hypothetical protein
MREQREEVVVPHPIEVFDNVDDDLDRIELWTAALSCFQQPAPEYQPDSVISDERKGMARSTLNETRDRTADVADTLKSAEDFCEQQARNTAPSLGDVVLNTIENQPYTAVTIALGLGWLLGRMQRAL